MSLPLKNKNVFRNYTVLERIEAGIVLSGQEVKSLRTQGGNLKSSFIATEDGELWIKNLHIPPYQPGNVPDSYQSEQRRKILVKEHEMISFARKQKEAGLSLVPISIYQKGRILKVELGLVKGKKKHDKRQDLKKRDLEREQGRKFN